MKIGARIIKTGIGVTVTMLIATLIPNIHVMQPTFVVVLGLQQSVKKTWNTLFQRALAAFLGGVTAVIMYHFFGNNAVVVGLTTMIFIMILNALHLQEVISLATITIIIIMLTPVSSVWDLVNTATYRVIENIIGVIIAFFVNVFIFPPHYDRPLYDKLTRTSSDISIRLRAILRKNGEYSSLNSDLEEAQNDLIEIRRLFNISREEPIWFKRKIVQRKRELVVFQSFINVTKEMCHLLYIIHMHANVLFNMDSHLRLLIRERIETLCAANEQIILKFEGRISPQEVNFFKPTKHRREKLMNEIFEASKIEGEMNSTKLEKSNALIMIAGAMIQVENELIHLNTIIGSYCIYHHGAVECKKRLHLK